MKSLRSLTGIRAVAAIWVLFFHSSFDRLPHVPVFIARAVGAGYAAVSLFFVLSGFILTYNYVSRLDSSKPGGAGLKSYFVARFARIYPVYLLALVLGAIFEGPLLNSANPPLPGALANVLAFFGLQAWLPTLKMWINFPSWSVSCELFFYASLPALLPLVRRIRPERAWTFFIAMGLVTTAVAAFGSYGSGQWQMEALFKFHPLLRSFEFVTGIALAYAFVHERVPGWLVRHPDGTILAAFAIAATLVAVCERDSIFLHSGGLALPYALIIVALAESRGAVHRFFSTSWAVLLGEASYSVYILQIPIKTMMGDIWHGWKGTDDKAAWFKALTFVSVLAISLLVNRFFENPMRKLIVGRFRTPSPAREA